jgi:indole-3-glycerol phosphate synthase
MTAILERILHTKVQEIHEARQHRSEAELFRLIEQQPPPRNFTSKLRDTPGLAIIAEIKKASPSAGTIRPEFDVVTIARSFEQNGADAISVLTDQQYFQGSLDNLKQVRSQVQLPTLRKDFLIDPYQLLESRAAGADAVLLIAECLPGALLKQMYQRATDLGLHVLLELHDAEQLPRVLDTGAAVIGINNRDLRTFVTRLEHTLELLPLIPKDRVIVSESGISTATAAQRLFEAGVKAVLVGEALMRSPDPGAALLGLRSSMVR